MRYFLFIFVALLSLSSVTLSQVKEYHVSDIRFKGLSQVSAYQLVSKIQFYLKSDTLTKNDLPFVVKQLFSEKYFKDIKAYQDDEGLLIEFHELPIIHSKCF